MPLIKLQFKPGINRDQTNYTNEGGWWDCDKVRFRAGFPQKIGGWQKYTPTAFLGVCRQMLNWVTTFADNFLALGTNNKVYIEAGGEYYDITPLRATFSSTDTDNCFDTTNTSADVTVNITGHGANDGDYVTFSGSTAIGGIPADEINAEHVVQLIDANSFVITVTTAATSDVSGGGGTSIEAEFQIEPGNRATTLGYGWGTGTWGRGVWGLGSTAPVDLPQRDWWFGNFDNDLVMNIRNGAPYYWQRGSTIAPDTSLATRAITLQALATAEGNDPNDVPVKVMQLLVSQNDRHLLAFGAVPYGSTDEADFDPLLIRWASQDEPSQWEPLVTNSAGFIRVSRGSRIVRALPTRQEILVFTDTNLFTLQFLGTTDVFGLQEYADNISVMSPRSLVATNDVVFWMGKDKFYVYTGRVETLACTVRDFVFNDIDTDQSDQIICGTNEQWNEVWWFYPSVSGGNNWNDRYVVFNYQEKVWYYGSLERTAWLDTPLRDHPQAALTGADDTSGNIYDHEIGLDDDGSAMTAYIESSDFDLQDGEAFMLTRRIIPDIKFTDSTAAAPSASLQVKPRNFPGSGYQNSGDTDTKNVVESAVDVYTNQVFIRARARQMALKVQSDATGVMWRLGSPRLDGRSDGRR